MKALSLWQPWASAIPAGLKEVETRSWATSYRGPLAIHAALRRPRLGEAPGAPLVDGIGELLWRLREPYTEEDQARRCQPQDGDLHAFPLPFGAVIATATLVDVVSTESVVWHSDGWLSPGPSWRQLLVCDDDPTETAFIDEGEREWGDYAPARFAWLLADIERLPEPVAARGRQQLWEWAA